MTATSRGEARRAGGAGFAVARRGAVVVDPVAEPDVPPHPARAVRATTGRTRSGRRGTWSHPRAGHPSEPVAVVEDLHVPGVQVPVVQQDLDAPGDRATAMVVVGEAAPGDPLAVLGPEVPVLA